MEAQIGSSKDSHKFRKEIASYLESTGAKIKENSMKINEFFRLTGLPSHLQKEKEDKVIAFGEHQNVMINKLQQLGQKIKAKQIQYADKAQNLLTSMVSNGDEEAGQL